MTEGKFIPYKSDKVSVIYQAKMLNICPNFWNARIIFSCLTSGQMSGLWVFSLAALWCLSALFFQQTDVLKVGSWCWFQEKLWKFPKNTRLPGHKAALNWQIFQWSLVWRLWTQQRVWCSGSEWHLNSSRKHLPQTHSAASLSKCLSLFLSLSFALWHTHKKKNWTRRDVFSFREKWLMIPITIILMEIIIMTVRIIVLILFVFKTPFYFVCLLHVCVTLCSNSIL